MSVLVNGLPVQYDLAPANCRDTLERYIEHGIPMGSFLTAFLSNDLMDALGRADAINAHQFHAIGSWLYCYAPKDCFGSPAKVKTWMNSRQQLQQET